MTAYTIKVKPTKYKGIKFRSKIEAQWAAFFDLTGIVWEYEPERFEKWEPDFLIKGIKPIYVEIKPFVNKETIKKYEYKCSEAIKSGFTIKDGFIDFDNYVVMLSKPIGSIDDDLNEGFQENPFGILYEFNGEFTFHSSIYWKDNYDYSSKTYSWNGLIGTSEIKKFFELDITDINEKWIESKNIIQTQINK